MLDSLDSRLLFLWKHCETNNVTVVRELGDAPAELRALLADHELRASILKLLHQRRSRLSVSQLASVRIFADDEEVEEMKRCTRAASRF